MRAHANLTLESGMALGMVLITAVIFSTAAFAALTMATSGRERVRAVSEDRLRAQYAAEAGIVWAMQRLWNNPTWSSGAGIDLDETALGFDVDGDGVLEPGVGIDLIMPVCGAAPCPERPLEAKVVY